MVREEQLKRLGLKFNPFPPATTGVAMVRELWIPPSWRNELQRRYRDLATAAGDKAIAIIGEYGSGKTFVLHWMGESLFQADNVQTFTFDNPGVAFYDLANRLLRQVGRYELAKGIWELLSTKLLAGGPQRLIPLNFPEWLASVKGRTARDEVLPRLASIIKDESIADDEEIAYRVARVVAETGDRPYFEYRDFVAGRPGALVAEREEAAYFRTLMRILDRISGANGVAFLIDEFEDVALQRRLNKKQSFEYLATLRRLLNATREEEFWLVISMTPEAFQQTRGLDPSLIERFSQPYTIPPLTDQEAVELIKRRLQEARVESRDDLWPFSKDAFASLRPTTISRPRPLIKVCWQAIAKAVEAALDPPITSDIVREAEAMVLPVDSNSDA